MNLNPIDEPRQYQSTMTSLKYGPQFTPQLELPSRPRPRVSNDSIRAQVVADVDYALDTVEEVKEDFVIIHNPKEKEKTADQIYVGENVLG